MKRWIQSGLAVAAMASCGVMAQAQVVTTGIGAANAYGGGYGYPAGYGAYGWNGWGGTVNGDVARGLGAFAAGLGEGRLRTAQAQAIQGAAVVNLNEYLYRAQQIRNQRYAERAAADRERINDANDAIEERILKDPDPRDIRSGAALNRMLDRMRDPRMALTSTSAGTASVPGRLVKSIPFQHQPGAVAVSLAQLTAGEDMPAAFREGGPLAEQGKAMRDAAARLDQEDQEGQIKPESINALQDSIDRAWDGLDKTYPAAAPDARRADNDDTRTRDLERHRAERYLKAVSGFARMLEAPQMESLLADVERRDAVTIGSLISFMTAFNLQFGPAEDAETEATYAQLYPMLANLHQDVAPQDKAGDADRKADRGEAKDQPKERAETKNAGAPSTDARARTGGDAETKPKARDRDRVPYDFFEGFDEKDLRRPRRGAGAGAGEEGRKPAVKVDRETERKPQGGTPRRDVDPTRDVDPAPEPRKASDPPLPNLVNPPAFTPSPNNNRATGKPGLSIPPEA